MLPYLPDDLQRYIQDHSSEEDPVLTRLAAATRERTSDPQMMAGHVQGLFLRAIVHMTAARRVLEIGTFTGYSALAMASALPDDGEIVTCDVDPEATAIAREFWHESPHGRKIRLVLGRALDTVASMPGPFDLVFIDADKKAYTAYWDACVPKLRPAGVILVDNVLWRGKVVNPDSDTARVVAAFNDHAAHDPRVERVVLPLRDGVLLGIRV